jgi:hypothetical protein
VTLSFRTEGAEAPLIRQPSNKGLTILDARHDPRSGETRLLVSVCRVQPLSVEGVDPEGVYRVQVDGEPARLVAPRVTRTIQALLSKQSATAAAPGLRDRIPGTLRFLDLLIEGDEDRFVERTIRISRIAPEETATARAALRAAIPARTGRVT